MNDQIIKFDKNLITKRQDNKHDSKAIVQISCFLRLADLKLGEIATIKLKVFSTN